MFPETRSPDIRGKFERALASGNSASFTFYFAALEAWFLANFYPGPEGLAIYFRDVSRERDREQQLQERMKELHCLYLVSSLSADQHRPIEKVLEDIVAVVPAALVHSDLAMARICHDETEFLSDGWSEPELATRVAIFQGNQEKGWVEIAYPATVEPAPGEGSPFLPEEREMLNVIAIHVSQMLANREASQRLAQSERLSAIGQLTGGVAHDFNNLLTVILGNAELLKEQLTDRQPLQALAEITATAAARGAELTNRLLAFSRRQALEPQVVDVNRLIADMEGMLRRALMEDIDFELVRAGGLWLTEVDPGQLESALLNLAINARDAMPGGGHLTVETANAMLDDAYADEHHEVKSGQYVLVSVSDTGTGMPGEIVSRAFEPFFTTKSLGKGSGLGLSMVYGFVKQSGGHAKIYSEPGEGTTVKLYFPRHDGGSESLPDPEPATTVTGGREHVLVVEDNDLVRQYVISLLQGLGYRVTSAGSGPEAVHILQESADIDLLFTDVVMPGGMNGRELADTAYQLHPGIRVLFTSGYTENAIVHHGRLDRGVQLLSKPYRRQELATKLRKVLDEAE
ncbi:ATP-binding protein [Kineobactrum salinum]|uniref:histidine kinase n=1 Tax=Kineobactrum salinum TaxID=2708301 RepID=A0A6C0U4S7_9GAMM|nr:ATP-binding protein [Kineobactrum salinum]QIB64454.1 response regulator [Kineobactrum salinum]